MATDVHALPRAIEQDIKNQFAVPQVGMRLWGVAPEYAGRTFARGQRRCQAVCQLADGAVLRPEHRL